MTGLGRTNCAKKNNYVIETLRSMEHFYDPNFSDTDCEGMHANCFNTLTNGGNAMAYDELNDELNLWNKSCRNTPKFETVSNMTVIPCLVLTLKVISVAYANTGI